MTEAEKTEAGEAVEAVPDAAFTFLDEITGSNVIVKLSSNAEYRGKLQSIDGFMNIALEDAREVINSKQTADFGDVFIRGSNVLYISAA